MDRGQPLATHGINMKYRPEIDGLRGIAVTSVVLYHASFSTGLGNPFPGGFVGVDIFFVVSGYLISEILLSEFGQGKFSFARFYERRARRILPALLFVMVCSLIVGWFVMLPKAFSELANSTLSGLFFFSNFYFWMQDSYTAEPSALKPLLHLWSLSVEEQFYIVFPPLLLLMWTRARRYLGPLLICGFVVSLALAQWESKYHPNANFFLPATRAWELIAGALLAFAQTKLDRQREGDLPRRALPGVGIACLLVAIFTFHDGMRHPGLLTLIPIVGSMLIIWFCTPGEFVTRMLSSRPMRAVGLVSYSFYLWHFPVFAFSKLASSSSLLSGQKIILILISLALAVASYALIEQPFRRGGFIPSRIFARGVVVALLVVLAGSSSVVAGGGLPGRLPDVLATAAPSPEWWQLKQNGEPCHRNENLVPCSFHFGHGSGNWVLIGDSHAGVLANSLYEELSRQPIDSFSTFIWGGCPFILNVRQETQQTPSCEEANNKKLEFLAGLKPSTVVISNRLGFWLENSRFDNGEGGKEEGALNPLVATSGTIADNVARTVRAVLDLGHRVILVYPIPEVGWSVPQKVLAEAKTKTFWELQQWLKEGGLETSMDLYFRRQKRSFAAYDAIGDQPGLLRIYPHKLLCDEEKMKCMTHNNDFFFYSDDNHLSHDGAKLLVRKMLSDAVGKWPDLISLSRAGSTPLL
jgi:peptidoglycan/LPS O-acetylase OafA/YrhL